MEDDFHVASANKMHYSIMKEEEEKKRTYQVRTNTELGALYKIQLQNCIIHIETLQVENDNNNDYRHLHHKKLSRQDLQIYKFVCVCV